MVTRMYFTAELPADLAIVEVRYFSERNKTVSRLSETSPADPHPSSQLAGSDSAELYFPIVDIVVEPGMSMVLRFPEAKDHAFSETKWAWNGHSGGPNGSGIERIRIDGAYLQPWENSLFVGSPHRTSPSIYLSWIIPVLPTGNRTVHVSLQPLAGRTRGSIQLVDPATNTVVQEIPVDALPRASDTAPAVFDPLAATLRFIQSSVVRDSMSPFFGGLHTFFDFEADTFRMPHWIWSWGPSIKLLLACSRLDRFPVAERKRCARTAEMIGHASLRFQEARPGHRTDRLGTVRWDPVCAASGYREYITGGSDANFLSGLGWIPLYEATGNDAYLRAAERLAEKTLELVEEFGVPPQDWDVRANDWTEHTLDESGFGVEGFEALYRVTHDLRYRAGGKAYIDAHIQRFERPDGLWERKWLWRKQAAKETQFMTRGQGWALEGLISAFRLTGDSVYLEKACRLADVVLSHQQAQGFWFFIFNDQEGRAGIGDKATALFAYLLSELFILTGDAKYKAAAAHAVRWFSASLCRDQNSPGFGSCPVRSHQSAVVYRRYFPCSCVYASAFFGLAMLAID